MALQEAGSTGDPDLDEVRRLVEEHGEDTLFPPLDGTAFFLLICRINHSCMPNVSVRYSCLPTHREETQPPIVDAGNITEEEFLRSCILGDGLLLDAKQVLSGKFTQPWRFTIILAELMLQA